MKNRIIGIILCIVLLITGLAATILVRQEPPRVHQHRSAAQKPECTDHGEDAFCTHLPLVKIETGGKDIPGKPIFDEKGHHTGFTTAQDGSDRILSTVKIIDHENANNHPGDDPTLESEATIHVHGNSSRYFDKLNYKIKLLDSEGNSNNQSVMGMAAHSEWVLHGPYLDKTLMRNYMWYNIGGEIMSYAPNVRFCEVFINGEYEGVYVMTETITAGENGARLQLSVDKKDNTYSGYLLRMDRTSEYDINNFTKYAYRLNMTSGINIEYPGKKNLTPELATSITKDFSSFEKAIYSYDFDNDAYGYKKLIDVDSFVDYFIINEVTANYDAGGYSTYIYKGKDGKFRMCIWDFNNACDNYQEQSIPKDDFRMINIPWFWMLVKNASSSVTASCARAFSRTSTSINTSTIRSNISATRSVATTNAGDPPLTTIRFCIPKRETSTATTAPYLSSNHLSMNAQSFWIPISTCSRSTAPSHASRNSLKTQTD